MNKEAGRILLVIVLVAVVVSFVNLYKVRQVMPSIEEVVSDSLYANKVYTGWTDQGEPTGVEYYIFKDTHHDKILTFPYETRRVRDTTVTKLLLITTTRDEAIAAMRMVIRQRDLDGGQRIMWDPSGL